MSSEIVIRDGRRLPNKVRDALKSERRIELGYSTGTSLSRQELYTIGERHAVRRIPSNILNLMIPQARKSVMPRFTIGISKNLLDSLDSDLPVYTTGSPLDIQTIGDLREQMSEKGYTTLYWEDVDRDQMVREVAERSNAYEKGQRTLAKRAIRQNLGVKRFRRISAELHRTSLQEGAPSV